MTIKQLDAIGMAAEQIRSMAKLLRDRLQDDAESLTLATVIEEKAAQIETAAEQAISR